MYVVTECCSESRMRSRTSRGVPEWSGGKDLYMGSPVLVTEKVSGAIGNVPGPPEGFGGPPGGATSPGGLHGPSVGGDQPQVGWCAPHQGPRRLGFGGTLKGAPPLPWGARQPPWPPPPPQIGSEGAVPPLPCPYIKRGEGGLRTQASGGSLSLP